MKTFITNNYSTLLTVISALMYAAAFVWIDTLWWCSCLFLVPIIFVCSYRSLRFVYWQGFIWGLITYGIQLSALFLFISTHIVHVGSWIAPSCIFLLMALSSGIWFWLLNKTLTSNISTVIKVIGVTGASFGFFVWIHAGLFFVVIGQWYGYPFSFPLVPVFYASGYMQYVISKGGLWISLATLIFVQIVVAFFIIFKNWIFLFAVILFGITSLFYFVPYSVSVIMARSVQEIREKSSIVCCKIPENLFFQKHSLYDRAVVLCQIVAEAQREYPDARVLVLPESVFPYTDAIMHERLARMLSDYCHPNASILLGVYRKESSVPALFESAETLVYNSCMCVQAGCVLQYYDKHLLIPFFEYVPSCLSDILFSINGTNFVGSGDQDGNYFTAADSKQCCIIKICAELFWQASQEKSDCRGYPIIALVNDAHFAHSYFKKLMRAWAECQVSSLGQFVVYSGW